MMHYGRTPELSDEGTREILEEIENGSPNTPERRATFERMRGWREKIDRLFDTNREKAPVENG